MLSGAVAVLASGVLAGLVFASSLRQQRAEAANAIAHIRDGLEHELAVRAFAIEIIAAQAEGILAGRIPADAAALSRIAAAPDKGGYELLARSGGEPEDPGSLTGLGPLPAPGSPLAAEVAMALSLAPMFRATLRADHEVPWLYYLSRRRFLYIQPSPPRDEVFVSDALLDMHFQLDGRPLERPERRIYWSPIYVDMAGKGLLATASRPIFEGERFVGTLDVDVGIDALLGSLAHDTPAGSRVRLLDRRGADMLPPTPGAPWAPLPPLPAGEQVDGDGVSLIALPVGSAGWSIVVETSVGATLWQAARESVVYGLLVLFTLVSLGLIVSLTRSLRELAALSDRDELTGLYNRRRFEEAGRREFARARRGFGRAGLVVIDVDQFKLYNDTYGHPAGDRALCAIGSELQRTLRREGDLLCRLGGEEFVVLTAVECPTQTVALANRLCQAVRDLRLEHPTSPEGHVTISVGAITVAADPWIDLEAAYRRADAALYASKSHGRNRVTEAVLA